MIGFGKTKAFGGSQLRRKGSKIIINETLRRFGGVLGNAPFRERVLWGELELFSTILEPIGRFWAPFWRSLDFEGVPESIIFAQSNINYKKVATRSGAWKTNWIMMESGCEKDVPGEVKKRFSHFTCCILHDLAGHEIWWKWRSKSLPKSIKNRPHRRPGIQYFGHVLWDVWFLTTWKAAPGTRKLSKMVDLDAWIVHSGGGEGSRSPPSLFDIIQEVTGIYTYTYIYIPLKMQRARIAPFLFKAFFLQDATSASNTCDTYSRYPNIESYIWLCCVSLAPPKSTAQIGINWSSSKSVCNDRS